MRVALVHDWINGMRGGEKCLENFLRLYPDADVYTLVHEPGKTSKLIDSRVVATSWIQKIPGGKRFYRWLLPFYPMAIASISKVLKQQDYDLIISTSHAVAKNVKYAKGATHICYCFTPMRYIWDQAQAYLGKLVFLAWPLIFILRRWDRAGSSSVHHFVAISNLVAARIRCFYKRRALVIHPAVDTSWIPAVTTQNIGQAFLVAGALVPYKRVDLAILACNKLNLELWIAGSGPEIGRLKSIAGPRTKFLGRVSDAELASLYGKCRALIFPGKEDFGMIPVEVQASGRPVLALKAGGALETVQGNLPSESCSIAEKATTGVFFKYSNVDDLVRALKYFMAHETSLKPQHCIANSKEFAPEKFLCSWNSFLKSKNLSQFCSDFSSHEQIKFHSTGLNSNTSQGVVNA